MGIFVQDAGRGWDVKRMRLIDADALIEEYDRIHVGQPGGARKLMEDAPTI